MTELTHEEVSELLGPYSSGELQEAMRMSIESHLATCEGCARELVGITALQGVEIEPMTGAERERVTAAVRSAVLPVAGPRWSERFGRRLAPALGAAALVVVAIIGYVSFQEGEGSSPAQLGRATEEAGENEVTADSTMDADSGAASDSGTATRGAKQKAGKSTSAAASSESLEAEADMAQGITAPNVGAPVTVAVERRFARTTFSPDLFAPSDARDRPLAFDAGEPDIFVADDPTVGSMFEECARTVIETSPHPMLTPTYAAHFPADDIIVIGFVWRDQASDRLNFELRGWRGDSCDRVSPIYRSGPV